MVRLMKITCRRNWYIYIISFVILFALFVSNILQHIKIRKQEYTYDALYARQWYLNDYVQNATISTKTANSSFVVEDIMINSNITLGVTDFWDTYVKKNKKELLIAVIDSRVDIFHEDLKQHIWYNKNEIKGNGIDDDQNGYVDDYYGWDFNTNSPNTYRKNDEAEHGTHCAGIIASNHNGIGVMGILGNTNVKLMILPIAGEKVDSNNLISAIKYAKEMDADICNISCVVTDGKKEIDDLLLDTDMYLVVSAGNFQNTYMNGLNLEDYELFPACCESNHIITVGSVNEKGILSLYSNYSSIHVDISAPGEYIYSTLPDGEYGYLSGTSSATPIVTGILGAYYYSMADSIEEAVKLLFTNCQVNDSLQGRVKEKRIVRYMNP